MAETCAKCRMRLFECNCPKPSADDSQPLNDLLCGCGEPVRYVNSDGVGACNKYSRCPTYTEQVLTVQKQNCLLRAYRAKREVDGLNGRKWDASKQYQAESVIERLEKEAST